MSLRQLRFTVEVLKKRRVSRMPRKPVKKLYSGIGGPESIDEEIRPLILILNRMGYRTRNSCMGDVYLTGEITFQPFSPPLSKEEVEEIKSVVREFTPTPFHIIPQKGRGGVMTIVFRGNIYGDISQFESGKESGKWGDSVLEYNEEDPEETAPQTIERIKRLFGDESYWE